MLNKILLTVSVLAAAVTAFGQNAVMVNNSNAVITYPSNFWSANAIQGRTGLGLGSAATNPASAFQPSSTVLSNLAQSNAAALTNITASNVVGTVSLASNVTGTVAVVNGGTGATNAAGARSSLGLDSAATNPASAFQPASAVLTNLASNNGTGLTNLSASGIVGTLALGNGGTGATNAADARANLGLGWSALTNSNAGVSLVSVDTNGSVVSPANFWEAAPIATALQESTPVANSTNAATNARLLFLFSLAPSTVGVTNTITLPTNGNTYNGDVATITHSGPTSSVTAIRQLGASTNLITLNQPEETVRLLYRNDQWTLMDNISQIEPIYFSGANATANAAASRTNLGLGWLALTNPQSSLYSGLATRLFGFVPEVTQGGTNLTGNNILAYTNTNTIVIPANILIAGDSVPAPRSQKNVELNGTVTIRTPFSSPTAIYGNNSIIATDDSSYTNVIASFGSNSVGFSNVTASGTLTATSTITAKTNLVVEGFVDFTTNHTNTVPAVQNQPNKFVEVRIGTNQYWLPLYQ